MHFRRAVWVSASCHDDGASIHEVSNETQTESSVGAGDEDDRADEGGEDDQNRLRAWDEFCAGISSLSLDSCAYASRCLGHAAWSSGHDTMGLARLLLLFAEQEQAEGECSDERGGPAAGAARPSGHVTAMPRHLRWLRGLRAGARPTRRAARAARGWGWRKNRLAARHSQSVIFGWLCNTHLSLP